MLSRMFKLLFLFYVQYLEAGPVSSESLAGQWALSRQQPPWPRKRDAHLPRPWDQERLCGTDGLSPAAFGRLLGHTVPLPPDPGGCFSHLGPCIGPFTSDRIRVNSDPMSALKLMNIINHIWNYLFHGLYCHCSQHFQRGLKGSNILLKPVKHKS